MFRQMIEQVLEGKNPATVLAQWESDEVSSAMTKIGRDEGRIAKARARLAQVISRKKAALDTAQKAADMAAT